MKDFRVAAIDDAPFSRAQEKVACACVISRGAHVEGVSSFSVSRDGFDSTKKIISCLRSSRFTQGIKLILLNGVALAGLNTVDITLLSRSIGVPVIALTDNKPRPGAMLAACRKARKPEKRIQLLEKAGEMREFSAGGKKMYFQSAGASAGEAKRLLSSFNSFPAPLRLAHLIAGAFSPALLRSRRGLNALPRFSLK